MARKNQNFFAMIGDITISSAQKAGEVSQIPVNKVKETSNKVSSKFNKPETENKSSESEGLISKFKALTSKSVSDSSSEGGLLSKIRGAGKNSKESISSFRSQNSGSKFKRSSMSQRDIEVFKGLVQENKSAKDKEEEKRRKKEEQEFQKASLEGLLNANEDVEGLDSKLVLIGGILGGLVLLAVVVALGLELMIGLALMMLVIFIAVIIVMLPKLKSGGSNAAAARELPFALRQMSTELKSGIGLHDSMRSIATSGYGPLSDEFAYTLEEIKYGETTEEALEHMARRMNSEGMTRAVYQINRTLGSGGDLAGTLTVIADDLAYEMRMKLNDYAQKLNSFTMIYMFIAVLGPVILLIMLMAATNVMKQQLIPDMGLILIYLIFFPAIVAFIILLIKRLEPKM